MFGSSLCAACVYIIIIPATPSRSSFSQRVFVENKREVIAKTVNPQTDDAHLLLMRLAGNCCLYTTCSINIIPFVITFCELFCGDINFDLPFALIYNIKRDHLRYEDQRICFQHMKKQCKEKRIDEIVL